ncbi:MAG: hypothetical protein V4438_02065 [Patescibacteria group bacterium]
MNVIQKPVDSASANETSSTAQPADSGEKNIAAVFLQIEELQNQARELELKITPLSVQVDKMDERSWAVLGIVLTLFVGTVVLVALDYFRNNEERYEKFVDKADEIRSNFYLKSEVDQKFIDFKNCIWYNGLNHCLK